MAVAGFYAPSLGDVATKISNASPVAMANQVVLPQGKDSWAPEAKADAVQEQQQRINSGITYPDDRPSVSAP